MTGHMDELVNTGSTKVLRRPSITINRKKAVTTSRQTPNLENPPSNKVENPIIAATKQNKDCAKRECSSSAMSPVRAPVSLLILGQSKSKAKDCMFLIDFDLVVSLLIKDVISNEKS